MKNLLLLLAFSPTFLLAQSRKERKAAEAQQKADQQVIASLKSHVQYLTANKTDGGVNANDAVVRYISTQFKTIGLQPKGTEGYIQAFKIDDGKKIEPATYLKINDTTLQLNKEYFPLAYSAEKKVTGMPAMALKERGVPWFTDIKDWIEENSKSAGFNLDDAIKKEVARSVAKGATALFLYNTSSSADGLQFNKKDKSSPVAIPVIYITPEGYKKYFGDHSQMLDVDLNIAFSENNISGNNVIGYLDNAASSTIVIGAHYNHSTDNAVGADDNGSGVAMMIELARMLAASKAKHNNYMFIALSGNDKGLAASNYWIQNATVTVPINYMLNLDMVGRYSETNNLSIQGFNSSPVWNELFTLIADNKLHVNIDSIGAIADPHASFYQKGIPVLSFSSSKHENYVNTADEETNINYAGELQIAKFISRLVEATDSKGRLSFARSSSSTNATGKTGAVATTEVRNVETTAAMQRATVSLGVIPDRTNAAQTGLKIIGVTPKKLADKIGLQAGDVLTYLGSYKIADMKSYLQALSNFNVGDKTVLGIKRGKDDKEFTVQF
jgi:hypothetical protein